MSVERSTQYAENIELSLAFDRSRSTQTISLKLGSSLGIVPDRSGEIYRYLTKDLINFTKRSLEVDAGSSLSTAGLEASLGRYPLRTEGGSPPCALLLSCFTSMEKQRQQFDAELAQLFGLNSLLSSLLKELGERRCLTCGSLIQGTDWGGVQQEIVEELERSIVSLSVSVSDPHFSSVKISLAKYTEIFEREWIIVNGERIRCDEPPSHLSHLFDLLVCELPKELEREGIDSVEILLKTITRSEISGYGIQKIAERSFSQGIQSLNLRSFRKDKGRPDRTSSGDLLHSISEMFRCSKCEKFFGGESNQFEYVLGPLKLSEVYSRSISDIHKLLSEQSLQTTGRHEQELGVLTKTLEVLQQFGLESQLLNQRYGTLSSGEYLRCGMALLTTLGLSEVLLVLDCSIDLFEASEREWLLRRFLEAQKDHSTVAVVSTDRDTCQICDEQISLDDLESQGLTSVSAVTVGGKNDISKESISLTARRLEAWMPTDLCIPVGVLTCIHGQSGSGKSVVLQSLYDLLQRRTDSLGYSLAADNQVNSKSFRRVLHHSSFRGGSNFTQCLAELTGAYPLIVDLLVNCSEGRLAGLSEDDFALKGERGSLAESEKVLNARYEGLNVVGLLGLTVAESLNVFADQVELFEVLSLLNRLGLGAYQLGRRVEELPRADFELASIVRLLADTHFRPRTRRKQKPFLFLFDLPLLGIFPDQAEQLCALLRELVAEGDTVVCCDNSMILRAAADFTIELAWRTATAQEASQWGVRRVSYQRNCDTTDSGIDHV